MFSELMCLMYVQRSLLISISMSMYVCVFVYPVVFAVLMSDVSYKIVAYECSLKSYIENEYVCTHKCFPKPCLV